MCSALTVCRCLHSAPFGAAVKLIHFNLARTLSRYCHAVVARLAALMQALLAALNLTGSNTGESDAHARRLAAGDAQATREASLRKVRGLMLKPLFLSNWVGFLSNWVCDCNGSMAALQPNVLLVLKVVWKLSYVPQKAVACNSTHIESPACLSPVCTVAHIR